MPVSPKTLLANNDRLQTGVYCWINLVNGKWYIGSTSKSFGRRKNEHLQMLREMGSYNVRDK